MTITFTQADVKDIAEKFVLGLQDALTADEFYEVQKLNSEEERPEICHSHDFCDANVVMLEAMESCGFKTDNFNDERWNLLWNAAWSLAKQTELTLKGE